MSPEPTRNEAPAAARIAATVGCVLLSIGCQRGDSDNAERHTIGAGSEVGSLAQQAVAAASSLAQDVCRGMPACRYQGRCALATGACVASDDKQCRQAMACADWGTCTARQGRCVATRTEDCRASWICRNKGRCTAERGACVVAGDRDCRRSELCKRSRKCRRKRGWCVRDRGTSE